MLLVSICTLGSVVIGNVWAVILGRPARVAVWLVFGFMVAVVIMSNDAAHLPDMDAYRAGYYEGAGLRVNELGYSTLVSLARAANVSFESFRTAMVCGGLVLVLVAGLILTKRAASYLSLYFVYPFLLDLVQFRDFVAMALVLWAVILLSRETRRGSIGFWCLMVIAASIHTLAIVYVPLFWFRRRLSPSQSRILLFVFLVIAFLFVGNRDALTGLVQWLAVGDERLTSYSEVLTGYGFVVPWVIWLLGLLAVGKARTELAEYANDVMIVPPTARLLGFVELVYRLNVMAAVYLPFMLLDATYNRLLRNVIPVNLLALLVWLDARAASGGLSLDARASRGGTSLVAWATMWLAWLSMFAYLVWGPYLDAIVLPIFSAIVPLGGR